MSMCEMHLKRGLATMDCIYSRQHGSHSIAGLNPVCCCTFVVQLLHMSQPLKFSLSRQTHGQGSTYTFFSYYCCTAWSLSALRHCIARLVTCGFCLCLHHHLQLCVRSHD